MAVRATAVGDTERFRSAALRIEAVLSPVESSVLVGSMREIAVRFGHARLAPTPDIGMDRTGAGIVPVRQRPGRR